MRIVSLALLAALAGAQTAPPMASIEGVVTDAVSGAALRDVTLGSNRGDAATAKTDGQGHYVFRNLNGGFYQIIARNEGYVTRSAFVRVLAGQEVKGIDLKLEREALLAGRVLDQEKNPVAQARVSLRSQGHRDGRPSLSSYRSALTNDLGEFRIAAISPGRYYLEAEPKPLPVRKVLLGDARQEREPAIANVRTYYGRPPNLEGAARLAFSAGQQMEGFDLTLPRERTVCMNGSVAGAAGDAGQRYSLTLSEVMPASQSRVAAGSVSAGDEFEICGVPPGAYRLSAFTGGDLRYTSQVVYVTNRPVAPLRLIPAPAMSLKGTVAVEGAKPEDPLPATLRVNLEVKDRLPVGGESTSAPVDPAGAFVLPSVLLDEYWLRVNGLPAGYYVKQATVNGRDALRDPVRTGQGDLAILLAADGPTISGSVKTADNQPVPGAMAFLSVFPLPQTLGWGDIRIAFADQTGFFSFPSMPPGEYRLLAFAPLSDDAAQDPETVRANLPKAMELTLAPKEKKTVTLPPLEYK